MIKIIEEYYCDNCGEKLNEDRIFSMVGFSHKCCCAGCLAFTCLNVRVASIKNTRIAMGELDAQDMRTT